MLFEFVGRKVFPVQAIVPSMHCNAVIPDGGGNVDAVIQMFVLFAFVQFEFVRFNYGAHIAHLLSEVFYCRPIIPRSKTVGFLGRLS